MEQILLFAILGVSVVGLIISLIALKKTRSQNFGVLNIVEETKKQNESLEHLLKNLFENMANNTTNYGLQKPLVGEKVDVNVINQNMDKNRYNYENHIQQSR